MIFIDSDCIVDFLKGKKEAIEAMLANNKNLATTEINVFEVLFGIHLKKEIPQKELEAARRFFDSVNIIPFDEGCRRIAAEISSKLSKKGEEINQNDCFVA